MRTAGRGSTPAAASVHGGGVLTVAVRSGLQVIYDLLFLLQVRVSLMELLPATTGVSAHFHLKPNVAK